MVSQPGLQIACALLGTWSMSSSYTGVQSRRQRPSGHSGSADIRIPADFIDGAVVAAQGVNDLFLYERETGLTRPLASLREGKVMRSAVSCLCGIVRERRFRLFPITNSVLCGAKLSIIDYSFTQRIVATLPFFPSVATVAREPVLQTIRVYEVSLECVSLLPDHMCPGQYGDVVSRDKMPLINLITYLG